MNTRDPNERVEDMRAWLLELTRELSLGRMPPQKAGERIAHMLAADKQGIALPTVVPNRPRREPLPIHPTVRRIV